jgi:hypothetical protein
MPKRGIAPNVTYLCSKCRYDLTRATRDICPGCGEVFDRDRMLDYLGRDPGVWRIIGLILAIAPLAFAGLTIATQVLSKSLPENPKNVAMMVIFAVAAAAPIATTRLVFSEVVIQYRHWAHDSQSKMILGSAILVVLAVVEAAFMVGAYLVGSLFSFLPHP